MAEIKLKITKELRFPLEAEVISPDKFAGKTVDEIKKLEVWLGKEKLTIGDFFDVSGKSGEKDDLKIVIDGDLSHVKRIGQEMSGGEIVINGSVGMHVGSTMSGGKITVNGDAGDWAGAMMKGGELVINGNAGHYVGAAYRGNWIGMENGVIRVKGSIGNEAMTWARSSKGKNQFPFLYCGSALSLLGIHNHGGTIIVEGNVGPNVGADQAWGMIVVKGKDSRPLASYKKMGQVKEIELPNGQKLKGKFIEYSGDHATKKETNGRMYFTA